MDTIRRRTGSPRAATTGAMASALSTSIAPSYKGVQQISTEVTIARSLTLIYVSVIINVLKIVYLSKEA